jgi:hypothetical protein
MAEGSGQPYQLVIPQKDLQLLKIWGRRATALGMAREYTATLRAIHNKLTTKPVSWGDPLYRYEYLDVLVYRAVQDMLFVYYGVDEQRRIVYVKEFILRPGHVLGQEP